MMDFHMIDDDLADGRIADEDDSIASSVRIAIMAWLGESPFEPGRWTDWGSLLGGRDVDAIRAAVILAASGVDGVVGVSVTDIKLTADRRCIITLVINGREFTLDV